MPHRQRRKIIEKYIKDNSVGIEIGVWEGNFTNLILETKNIKKVYALDPWARQDEYVGRLYSGTHPDFKDVDMDKIHNGVVERFENKPVEVVRDFSTNVMKHIKENELDWAYIDGNHDYESTLEDLENCRVLVKNGGHLMCDDYGWHDKFSSGGVKKAVNVFCQKYDLSFSVELNNQAIIKLKK